MNPSAMVGSSQRTVEMPIGGTSPPMARPTMWLPDQNNAASANKT